MKSLDMWNVYEFHWRSGYVEHIEAKSAKNAMEAVLYSNGSDYVDRNLIRFQELVETK